MSILSLMRRRPVAARAEPTSGAPARGALEADVLPLPTSHASGAPGPTAAPSGIIDRFGGAAEALLVPALAVVGSLVLFGIFVALFGKSPIDLYYYIYQGAFGTWFSWQNTLSRSAPLILT